MPRGEAICLQSGRQRFGDPAGVRADQNMVVAQAALSLRTFMTEFMAAKRGAVLDLARGGHREPFPHSLMSLLLRHNCTFLPITIISKRTDRTREHFPRKGTDDTGPNHENPALAGKLGTGG